MNDQERIKVMLVDDHQMLRDGLTALINSENDMLVSGQASSGEEALTLLHREQPDVIVMDIGLQGMSGLETIQHIRKRGFTEKIIVLSMHNDQETISRVFRSGGDGFVPKSTAHEHLLSAIRNAAAGELYLHPGSAAEMFRKQVLQQPYSEKLGLLSERELEVCTLTAMGFTRSEISEQLNIQPKTVDSYRSRIKEKLGVNSRAELMEFAIHSGLLSNE